MPKLFIISGCNGAGKTTASYTILPEMFGLRECVNSDEIAERLSPNKPEAAAIRASRIMLERMNELMDKRADFGVETTLATRSLLRVIEDAKSLGYVVILIYFWLNSPATKQRSNRSSAASPPAAITSPSRPSAADMSRASST